MSTLVSKLFTLKQAQKMEAFQNGKTFQTKTYLKVKQCSEAGKRNIQVSELDFGVVLLAVIIGG